MNATAMAKNAYSSSAAPVRTDRSTEYDIIARITRRLKQTSASKNFAEFVAALHENRQLWTLLAVDVADEQNALPQELRAQIFYLAEFTLLHTSKALAGEATAEALIDINTSVMRGLRPAGASA